MRQSVPLKNKSNKAFMILSALGILFVVDAHTGAGVGFFTGVFPYDSFFMPMFMFISGYFWKEQTALTWKTAVGELIRKFRKLMIPYLLWAAFYGFLVMALNGCGMDWPKPELREFIYSLMTDGTTFSINGAAWFVPTLFVVTAAYTLLRRLLGQFWKDTAALIVLFGLGGVTVWLTMLPGGVYVKALHLYKLCFFIQFFHLGYCFHKRLEAWFDSVSTLKMCLCAAAVNLLLLAVYGDISFGTYASMSGFFANNPFLPLITSVTGICFWLKIAKLLEPVLGQNRLVNYISGSTFFIMMHHLLFVNVFSALLWAGKELGVPVLSGFDPAAFRADPWYLYTPNDWLKAAYFLFSVTAAVLSCKGFERIAARINALRKKAVPTK